MTRNRMAILALALLAVGACQDLDVVNENNPDTERALAEPAEVENVMRSAFNIWFDRFDFSDLYAYFPLIADEMTQTWTQRDIQPSIEPAKAAVEPSLERRHVVREFLPVHLLVHPHRSCAARRRASGSAARGIPARDRSIGGRFKRRTTLPSSGPMAFPLLRLAAPPGAL